MCANSSKRWILAVGLLLGLALVGLALTKHLIPPKIVVAVSSCPFGNTAVPIAVVRNADETLDLERETIAPAARVKLWREGNSLRSSTWTSRGRNILGFSTSGESWSGATPDKDGDARQPGTRPDYSGAEFFLVPGTESTREASFQDLQRPRFGLRYSVRGRFCTLTFPSEVGCADRAVKEIAQLRGKATPPDARGWPGVAVAGRHIERKIGAKITAMSDKASDAL